MRCSAFETIGDDLTCIDATDNVGCFRGNGMKVRVKFGMKMLNKFDDRAKLFGSDGIDGVG